MDTVRRTKESHNSHDSVRIFKLKLNIAHHTLLSNPGTPVKLMGAAFSTKLDLRLDVAGCCGGWELGVVCDAAALISSSDALQIFKNRHQYVRK